MSITHESFNILDPSWMQLEGTFDEQVVQLFYHVTLNRDEVEKELLRLFKDVENTLRTFWPGCELVPYGSLYQGTAFKTSDVDCFVQIPILHKTDADTIVFTARDILRRRSDLFAQISAASNVPVPIVKFFHMPTSRECDLTFDCPPGVSNSKLLWYLFHLDKKALDLAVLVKYWAKVHNFTGPYLLRTYALLLMVFFYLQQLRMLPTIYALQRNVPYVSWRVWNVAFQEINYSNVNHSSLKHLLGGFFKFFSCYDFEENVISPFVGCSIPRKRFRNISTIPKQFSLYESNLRLKLCEPFNIDRPMCVQDVFNHSSNCSVLVFDELGENIKKHFRLAAKLYDTESDETFLKAIFTKHSY
ncbi:terminal uridylyltransferase Tailor-like [Leguminivora glycinivorella]|uniref:terminal uridylyltransferase Tailor-like n=1 Tax=Leguminivora glycinivorella TaxID=1035111 RepID=UPI0020103AE2|nr:terminal uridylyltransferase Tailor-like [Leguminivora glycinivorella]